MSLHNSFFSSSQTALRFVVAVTALMPCAMRAEVQPLAQGAVDDTHRVTLRDNVHPMAQARYDRGRVDDSFAANRLFLMLKRSSEQEQGLRQFLKDAHTPGTASFHKWLTPEEFGKRFGVADSDIAAATAWLQSHGLTVNKVHPGRTAIEFSGTAAQIREAFQTEIHRYRVPNVKTGEVETHYANASDPQIPEAFARLVAGVSPMNSFHATPMIKIGGKTSYNPKTHRAKPEWAYPQGGGYEVFELAPLDFAVQYNLGSAYPGGNNGAGQSIGILSASNVNMNLVQAYRKLFSLPPTLPSVVIDGEDPGENGAAIEAFLDVEASGAAAPGANVILYASDGTILTDPLITSGLRAIDDNVVSVISMSYGTCEADLGASGNAAWASLWQEAAAQGITGFVSAGDGGSAGCDDFDTEGYAVGGLAVNGFGSTPYNVSVGGTDFYYSEYATGGSALGAQLESYWGNATSTSPAKSVIKQTIPEQVWNNAFGLNADDNGSYAEEVEFYGSTIVGGSGGRSAAAVYSGSAPAGYPKPVWQTGAGVPADKVRDLPDVSLYAANGPNYSYYPICASPGDCTNVDPDGGAVYITSVGGTSASSPSMAGIQALVDQATGSRQGQADYVYYALASKAASANSFHDVTIGGNEVPCDAGSPNCVLGTAGQTKGAYAESGYPAGKGYDLATGLGSVNVTNLIANWKKYETSLKPTTTTLTAPASFAHGATVTVSATVAPTSGSGTPTGSVDLTSNNLQIDSNGLDVFSLSGGAASGKVNNLPGGTYQLVADYSGDGSYSASASSPISVTVTPEGDTLSVWGYVVNPFDNNLYSIQPGMSMPYGSLVFLDSQPVGVNEAKSNLGLNSPATGTIAYTDKVGAKTTTAVANLNTQGVAEWSPASLAPGAHTISAHYAGDLSYKASSLASASHFTVTKGFPTISVSPRETNITAGGNVSVDVELASDYLPLIGALPTGELSVTLGSQTLRAALKPFGTTGAATEDAVVTFTKVPEGILPLSVSYPGDINWEARSVFADSVVSLPGKTIPTVTMKANKTTFLPTDTITLTATVAGTKGKTQPGGYVYFFFAHDYYYYWTLTQGASNSTKTFSFPANQLQNGSNVFTATYCGPAAPNSLPSGCTGDGNYAESSSAPLVLTLNGSDFSVTTPTPEVAVAIGKSGKGTLTVTPIDSYSGTVTVKCAAPAGITCSAVTGSPLVGAAGVSDAITINVSGTVTAGTYPVVLTVTGGGNIHTAQILVAAH